MRLGLAAVVLVSIGGSALAVVPRKTQAVRPPADTLTAMPGAHSKPLRTHVELRDGAKTSLAWQAFTARTGGTWDASYDAATGVPAAIWGSGIAVPGSSANPIIAADAAKRILLENLALLAPGATIDELELVSNHWDGSMRTIGFVQKSAGRRVVGGQVSFRFKHDRMFMMASQALPNVKSPGAARMVRLPQAQLSSRVTTNLRAQLAFPTAPVTAPSTEEYVLPLVGDAGVLGYRVAVIATIDGGAEGNYRAYVDPATGDVLAVLQTNMYASGTVQFRSVDRYPGRGRVDAPAPRVHIKLDGSDATTTQDGRVSWSPETGKTATLGVDGDLIMIVNQLTAGAATATIDMGISPNNNVTWDATGVETDDAQLVTYIAANTVKEYVRQHVDANLAHLDETMEARVNITQECNAYFDGQAINFFTSSANCENTGRILDVIYHEYGHNLHTYEIIEGVGVFDGAMSEGAADFLAATITKDSGMGRGFFRSDDALRELDPVDSEHIYPRDVGEIHTTGIIFGGTFWDLRKDLIAQYGEEVGVALTTKLYVGALRRSVNIPSSLFETLAEDDDDGNLANGTPHECAIRNAFGRHGMRTANGHITAPALLDVHAAATTVRVDLAQVSPCPSDTIANATLSWRPPYTGVPQAGSVDATRTGTTSFYGQIPLAQDESISYLASINFVDGTSMFLADNRADPYYQLYQGHTKALYCTNFDTNPFTEGWTTGTADGTTSPWEWGVPPGTGATDPPAAFTGTHALVQGLGGNYEDKSHSWVQLPPVDVGRYSDVRLQYRRWLATEDSYFDEAKIITNGKRAWLNQSAHKGEDSALHHIDREWRFHDVPLSGFFTGKTVTVQFDLAADEGLALGGWAIDDLCIVANTASVCGDGVKAATEVCDTGAANADEPDKCRTYCRLPTCGDNITDSNEECDEGPDGTETCTNKCKIIETPLEGGCECNTSSSAPPIGAMLLLGLCVVGLRPRRRR